MTDPIDDDRADWGQFRPEQLASLVGLSDTFATARRLISTIATSAEDDDHGDSLGRLLLDIAEGDAVGVALAAAVEAVLLAREVYGDHAGQVLALKAQRQMDLAARHRRDAG
ncbi:hypothetical protein [Mycobacterium sp. E787]|uniref:hypothetical protein n=1 Tax=Mycobacterium sp. E787 TaxID=1834150 RepID=UPI0007FC069A|nr:hypothetical protein [Mycobacterium sp. E787]OBI53594.1 hypothetical protein A5705_02975 [Mycobacterium sp. E787]